MQKQNIQGFIAINFKNIPSKAMLKYIKIILNRFCEFFLKKYAKKPPNMQQKNIEKYLIFLFL